MTFSILAHDRDTGAFGGAAATGNLCVGGWVLHADIRAGIVAVQGLSPNPLWPPLLLTAMKEGKTAPEALAEIVARDRGREARQAAALDRDRNTGAFDGKDNKPHYGHVAREGLVIAGNWLGGTHVLQAMADAFDRADGILARRLLAALEAGAASGGDARGLLSAAILVKAPNASPLDLRVDLAEDPIGALCRLYDRAESPDYKAWLATIPTEEAPERRP